MDNQKELDTKTRVSNAVRASLLQIGVDSYRIDGILNTLVEDILTVLRDYDNVEK